MSSRRSKLWSLGTLLAVLAALALGAVGCGDDDDGGGGGGGGASTSADGGDGGELQKVELLLSYQRSIAFIGEIIAQEKGYFADEGLEVEPIPTEGGQFVVQQIIAGNKKFGLSGTQNIDVGVSQGGALRSIWEGDRDIILIGTPADSGIKSIADLKGKSLGITDPGSGEVGLINGVLESAGILGEVDLPAVGPGGPAAFEALQSGKIAAYSGYTNDLAAVEAEGLKMRDILPEEFKGQPNNALLLSEETYNNKEDLDTLIKIARAWSRGTIYTLNNPEESLEIACEYVPEECKDMNTARAYLNATMNGIKPREGMQLGEFDYDSLEQQAGLLTEKDLGPEPIDFGTVFTNDHIDEINDFSEPKLEPDAPQLLEVQGGEGLADE